MLTYHLLDPRNWWERGGVGGGGSREEAEGGVLWCWKVLLRWLLLPNSVVLYLPFPASRWVSGGVIFWVFELLKHTCTCSLAIHALWVDEIAWPGLIILNCPPTQGYIESGLFKFTYGSKDTLVDFLHGDNFCQAHIKAAEAMEDPASPVVCYSPDCKLSFQY